MLDNHSFRSSKKNQRTVFITRKKLVKFVVRNLNSSEFSDLKIFEKYFVGIILRR